MSNARNIASIAGEDVLNASNEIVPVYACRAWVNFDGIAINGASNNTSCIRDQENVTSISEIAMSTYQINFNKEMPHTNYAALCSGGHYSNGSSAGIVAVNRNGANGNVIHPNTQQVTVNSNNAAGNATDHAYILVGIFC